MWSLVAYYFTRAAASKEDLVGMIQHGAERILNTSEALMASADDIDDIIRRGEERTAELNSKYQALGFDDLANFKSQSTQQWEGEDYAGKKRTIGMTWIEPAKRERKANYSIDTYYRDAMRQGPAKPRQPRAPKQVNA